MHYEHCPLALYHLCLTYFLVVKHAADQAVFAEEVTQMTAMFCNHNDPANNQNITSLQFDSLKVLYINATGSINQYVTKNNSWPS